MTRGKRRVQTGIPTLDKRLRKPFRTNVSDEELAEGLGHADERPKDAPGRKLSVTPQMIVEMSGPAAEATLNTLSGEEVEVTVRMDKSEKEDLDEYCRHHPELASTPGEALKKMAGLRGYRVMKQMVDPKRKKPSMDIRDLGAPSNIPCALVELLDKMGMTYADWMEASARAAMTLAERAVEGDETSKRALRALFVNIG